MQHKRSSHRLRNRNGFTLVLTAFFLTLLLGAAALAVDISNMYLNRAQLQASADAAALAGVVGLGKAESTTAQTSAISYARLNKVGGSDSMIVAGDVKVGTWNATGFPGFHETGNWSTGSAIQVTTRYRASWMFGRAFGKTTQPLTATAVAVHGSTRADTCTRPWAIPYQDLLDKIYTPGSKDPATYQLSANDVARLGALGPTSAGPVNFQGVKLPPAHYADGTTLKPYQGANEYDNNIQATCAGLTARMLALNPSNSAVAVDDWLDPENGLKTGKLEDGVTDYCTKFGCPGRIIAAIVDTTGRPSNCNPSCWHVKYMAEFMLTGVVSKKAVGYFVTTSASGSGLSSVPGPNQKNGLVK